MGEDDFSLVEFAKHITPIYGTIRDYNKMVKDPSVGNIGMFALSAAGDIPFIGAGFKALKAAAKTVKAVRAVSKAEKALKTSSRVGVARRARSRALSNYRDADITNKIDRQILLNSTKRNIKEGVYINTAQEAVRNSPYYRIRPFQYI